jgi:hypothetical protein
MRLRVIGCEVLARPLYLAAARSPQIVDLTLLKQGLHDRPGGLRERLQSELDATDPAEYDAIGLAYGLCGGATSGLVATTSPVVLPRAHDCITLFLGSRERHGEFVSHRHVLARPGLHGARRGGSFVGWARESDEAATRTYGVRRISDRDNADYLMEALGEWRRHYDRAAFIDFGVGDGSAVERRAQDEAAERGWRYDRLPGDMILLKRLVDGDWAEDFLVLGPGQRVVAAWDEGVVRAEPAEAVEP